MANVERINALDNKELFNESLHDSLWQIWRSGFDDTIEYFDFFWKGKVLSGDSEIFCMTDKNKLIGASYLLKTENAYYGYAFAILPEYRGQGLYKLFAQSFYDFARKRNTGLLISPASRRLADYYIANGAIQNYVRRMYVIENLFYENIIISGKIRDVTHKDSFLCKKLYETYASENHLKWNSESFEYAICENIKCGGEGILFRCLGQTHFAFVKEYEYENNSKKNLRNKIITDTSLPISFFKKNSVKILEKPLVTYNLTLCEHAVADFLLD